MVKCSIDSKKSNELSLEYEGYNINMFSEISVIIENLISEILIDELEIKKEDIKYMLDVILDNACKNANNTDI